MPPPGDAFNSAAAPRTTGRGGCAGLKRPGHEYRLERIGLCLSEEFRPVRCGTTRRGNPFARGCTRGPGILDAGVEHRPASVKKATCAATSSDTKQCPDQGKSKRPIYRIGAAVSKETAKNKGNWRIFRRSFPLSAEFIPATTLHAVMTRTCDEGFARNPVAVRGRGEFATGFGSRSASPGGCGSSSRFPRPILKI